MKLLMIALAVGSVSSATAQSVIERPTEIRVFTTRAWSAQAQSPATPMTSSVPHEELAFFEGWFRLVAESAEADGPWKVEATEH